MRRFLPALVLLLSSLGVLHPRMVTAPAHAQAIPGELPFALNYAWSGDQLTLTVETVDDLTGVALQLEGPGGRSVGRWTRARLGAGETWTQTSRVRGGEHRVELSAEWGGDLVRLEYTFALEVAEDMSFDVDLSTWDPALGRMELRMNQPAGHVELQIRDDQGVLMADRVIRFEGEPAGTPLVITWAPTAGTILTVDVKAVGQGGAWASRQYIPWQVQMDAVHVNFPSGSSEIPTADMPMLLERLATIQTTASRVAEWVEVHLYVAGYTDTVGASGDNQRLSEARARSLARFMREQGWAGPTFFQGFGEDVLEVDTADGVDEPRNRRAIFLLGTETRPGVRDMPRTSWQRLP